MKSHPLLIGAVLLALTGGVGLAQETPGLPHATQAGDLQRVTVGNLTYPLDPYNVFMCFSFHSAGDWTGSEVEGTYTMQCFIRKGSVMTPIDAFITDDSGIMEGLELGTPLGSEVVQ